MYLCVCSCIYLLIRRSCDYSCIQKSRARLRQYSSLKLIWARKFACSTKSRARQLPKAEFDLETKVRSLFQAREFGSDLETKVQAAKSQAQLVQKRASDFDFEANVVS